MVVIVDWDMKLCVLKSFFDLDSSKELYRYIYSASVSDSTEDDINRFSEQMSDNATHWAKGNSKTSLRTKGGPGRFWGALNNFLDLPEYDPEVLANCSIVDFFQYLPDDQNARTDAIELLRTQFERETNSIRQLAQRYETSIRTNGSTKKPKSFPMWVPITYAPALIGDGVQAGLINQCHYYLSPDAAAAWIDLIESKQYPSYIHCLDSIGKTMQDNHWLDEVQGGVYDTVVSLGGGGAPSKDLLLMESLLKFNDHLTYIIQDISDPLIKRSMQTLTSKIWKKNWGNRVDLIASSSDFLQLSRNFEIPMPRNSSSTVWVMTAGTLGNVDEAKLFASVNTRAAPGDLFLIAADTFDESEEEEVFRERVLKKYSHTSMNKYLSPVLCELQSYMDLPLSVEDLVSSIELDITNGISSGYTSVEGSRTVTFNIKVNNKKVTLLVSSRYNRESFIDFAYEQGWECLHVVPNNSHPDFVQFLLKKIGK